MLDVLACMLEWYQKCSRSDAFLARMQSHRAFLVAVHAAGGWAKYAKEHESLCLLRMLCARGRAFARPATAYRSPHLVRLFGNAIPSTVFLLVLEYWHYQEV